MIALKFTSNDLSLLKMKPRLGQTTKNITIQFLVAVTPSGFVIYVSKSYGGRVSDIFICQDSGFYQLLEYVDELMADKGLQIQDDIMFHYCKLTVPPGAKIKAPMTKERCAKTEEVANLRMHDERAINHNFTQNVK